MAGARIRVKGRVLWHWTLVAANGQVMATSETYYSKNNAMRAADNLAVVTGFPVEHS